mmetsp:Transcript_21927/g.33167  ORF Transcript_21927/g.33167 Transcript_21927/m.33167 type:complete len:85 (-) Transcript_21927:184-438(-)
MDGLEPEYNSRESQRRDRATVNSVINMQKHLEQSAHVKTNRERQSSQLSIKQEAFATKQQGQQQESTQQRNKSPFCKHISNRDN